MAPETKQPGVIGAESKRTSGASSNAPLCGTKQHHRHQFIHRDAAIVATRNVGQETHLKTVRNTWSKNNKK